jgi:hypothetical protein
MGFWVPKVRRVPADDTSAPPGAPAKAPGRAALVVGDGADFIDDDGFDITQNGRLFPRSAECKAIPAWSPERAAAASVRRAVISVSPVRTAVRISGINPRSPPSEESRLVL